MVERSKLLNYLSHSTHRTAAEDSSGSILRIELVAELLNDTLNIDGEQLWVSGGVQFTINRIWVGQIAVTINSSASYNVSNS